MKKYEQNWADRNLVVNDIKILGKGSGGSFTEIRRSVDAVKKTLGAQIKQQDEYWKALSDDGIVSTVEKQSLRREMENIRQSFSAVTSQAESFGYTNPLLQGYIDTYNALRGYIYDTLKLFNDMTSDSAIDDRDTFNDMFSNYYFMENFILLAITKGVLDTLEFRVLSSLNEPGEEGETGIYRGALYQYVDGVWKNVTTGAYKGALSQLPAFEDESFFLVSESFRMSDVLIVNGEELLVNGDTLLITHVYEKGYIYYCQDNVWYAVTDKTNWRYAAAFADVINITGELPQIFQDGLDDLQEQIDGMGASLDDLENNLNAEIEAREGEYTIIAGEIVQINLNITNVVSDLNTKVDHLPEYLGAKSTIPQNPKEGDFFLYIGATSIISSVEWYFANIYRWHNGAWQRLQSSESQYKSYYSMALEDILRYTQATSGYFNTAFADAFFSNYGVMEELSVRTIYLKYGGYIQSANVVYESERRGVRIDYAGNIDANQNTHLGGKVAIGVPLAGNSDFNTYDVVIGGNTKFEGRIETDKECYASGFELRGLKPGTISLRKMNVDNNTTTSWRIPAAGTISFHGYVLIGQTGGFLELLVNGETIYSWNLIDIDKVADEGFSYINNKYFNFDVEVGDTISVKSEPLIGGAGAGSLTFIGGLYSSTHNSLVTFLGETVFEVNPPSPVR